MVKKVVFWRRALMLITVFVSAVVISAFAGTIVVSDTVYFPLSDVRSAVSFTDAAVYSFEHCTSSALQMALLLVTSFSPLLKLCSVSVSIYRGGSLGFTASLISKGAVMASHGGILQLKSALPILILYFVCSMLMIVFSALSASLYLMPVESFRRKSCLAFCTCFMAISGAVFLLDIVKVWLI